MIKYYSIKYTLFLVALDTLAVVFGLLTATYLRITLPFGLEAARDALILPVPVYVLGMMIYAFTFALLDVRSPSRARQPIRELQVLTAASVLAWMVLLGALYLSYRNVSRLQIIYFLVIHLCIVISSRIALRMLRGKRYQQTRNVLILGSNADARQMYRIVLQHGWMGLRPMGILAVDEPAEGRRSAHVVGSMDDLETVVASRQVSEVIIAVERDTVLDLKDIINRLQALPVNIRLVPQYTDLAFLQVNVEDFSGMPLLTLKEPALTPYQRLVKRGFDLVMTLIILVPTLPIMAVIALLIRLDSRGPIIFQQERVGEGGRTFTMYKFRSMVQGAEWQQEEVLHYDQKGNLVHKQQNDPRITHLGHFIRATSIDELPQLFNILRGDMSLVGPRPEMPWLVDRYEPWQRKRFEVPQGLTGWWQVNGRASKPMHMSTEYDLFYIRNYSMWLDLKILWRTVWVVVSRRGAF
ncbi:MAG: sugar transferase [Chloroflexota bacterium]